MAVVAVVAMAAAVVAVVPDLLFLLLDSEMLLSYSLKTIGAKGAKGKPPCRFRYKPPRTELPIKPKEEKAGTLSFDIWLVSGHPTHRSKALVPQA